MIWIFTTLTGLGLALLMGLLHLQVNEFEKKINKLSQLLVQRYTPDNLLDTTLKKPENK